MTQIIPVWSTVFIGTGKSIIDQKEAQVSLHKDSYNAEKERSEKERAKYVNSINEVREMLRDIESSKLDSTSALKLRDALKIIEQLPEGLAKLSGDCKKAAGLFKIYKKPWSQAASKESVKKHPQLVPFLKRKAFKADILNYFEWVHACLENGGTRTTPLSEYVDIPVISSVEPYITAIEHVAHMDQWSDLTYQQKELTREVLDRLIELIRKKLIHSLTSL